MIILLLLESGHPFELSMYKYNLIRKSFIMRYTLCEFVSQCFVVRFFTF